MVDLGNARRLIPSMLLKVCCCHTEPSLPTFLAPTLAKCIANWERVEAWGAIWFPGDSMSLFQCHPDFNAWLALGVESEPTSASHRSPQ